MEILRFPVLQRGAWSAAAVAVDAGLDGAAVTVALLPAEGAELAEGEVAADVAVLGGVIDVTLLQPAINPSNVSPAIRAAT
jgi:hypothetical protein